MFASPFTRRTSRPGRRARRNALLVAGASVAILASPGLCASAQASGIDEVCTAAASLGFEPALNDNTVGTNVTGVLSDCLGSGGLTSGRVSTPTPLTASACFPFFSLAGNTLQIGWNDGTTSTLSVSVNLTLLTGVPALSASVIAGTLDGDTITPLPLLLPPGLCGVGGTTSLAAPLAVLVFSS